MGIAKFAARAFKSPVSRKLAVLAGIDTKANAIRTSLETAASLATSQAIVFGQSRYEAEHGRVADPVTTAAARSAFTGGAFYTPGTVKMATRLKGAALWGGIGAATQSVKDHRAARAKQAQTLTQEAKVLHAPSVHGGSVPSGQTKRPAARQPYVKADGEPGKRDYTAKQIAAFKARTGVSRQA